MPAGLTVQKGDLDFAVGSMSADLENAYQRATRIKEWMDVNYPSASPDPLVAALGYTATDAATIRAAVNDAAFQATQAYGSSAALKAVRGV